MLEVERAGGAAMAAVAVEPEEGRAAAVAVGTAVVGRLEVKRAGAMAA